MTEFDVNSIYLNAIRELMKYSKIFIKNEQPISFWIKLNFVTVVILISSILFPNSYLVISINNGLHHPISRFGKIGISFWRF